MAKDGFVIYKSFYKPISGMSDEQLGRLFRAIYEYQLNGTTEVASDIAIPFSFFQNRFEADTQKYETTCKRRSESGKKGAEAKSKQLLANATNCQQLPAIANTQANASNCYQMLANADDRIGLDRIGLDRIGEDRNGEEINSSSSSPYTPPLLDLSSTKEEEGNLDEMISLCAKDIETPTQYSEVLKMRHHKTEKELLNSLLSYKAFLVARNEHHKTFIRREFCARFDGYLSKEAQKEKEDDVNNNLGEGEYIKNGRRTYGNGEATVPMSAPKRPSSRYYWNSETKDWSM